MKKKTIKGNSGGIYDRRVQESYVDIISWTKKDKKEREVINFTSLFFCLILIITHSQQF